MKIRTLLVHPAPGSLVRYPGTFKQLPAEGAEVPDSPYWRRRIKQGDVLRGLGKKPAALVKEEPPAKAATVEAKPKK